MNISNSFLVAAPPITGFCAAATDKDIVVVLTYVARLSVISVKYNIVAALIPTLDPLFETITLVPENMADCTFNSATGIVVVLNI